MRPAYFKHIRDLRPEDFREHPVWVSAYKTDLNEPWYDEQAADEATFRPCTGPLPYDCYRPVSICALAAAEFVLADGMALSGYLEAPVPLGVPSPFDLGYIQPCVFSPDGVPCWFWAGGDRHRDAEKVAFYAAMRKQAEEVFPIRYRPVAGLLNVEFHGIIQGFAYRLPDSSISYET